MPLPVIHSYAGYSIYKFSLSEDEKKSWKMAALFMFLANLADMDYLPGMLVGSPDLFHRSMTHSLGAALIFSVAAAGIVKKMRQHLSFMKLFLVSLCAYFSHIVLDYMTGSMKFMLWPLRVEIHPIPFDKIAHHSHAILDCNSLSQFCSMLVSPTLMVRLFAEVILVYFVAKTGKFFSRSRAVQPGISESPAFVASLALFIFVLTALMLTEVAG